MNNDSASDTFDTPQPKFRLWQSTLFRLAVAGIVFATLCFIVYWVEGGERSILPPCIFHEATGLFCPGCGNTRALRALVHGDVLMTLRCNILLLPSIILLFFLILRPRIAYNRVLTLSVLIAFLLFSFLRNIPYFPFTLLAPIG